MVSEIQRDRVSGYLEAGKKEGAKATAGGKAREGTGYFIEPTVFVDTKPGMKIVKEEIFGPVVTVSPFKLHRCSITCNIVLSANMRFCVSFA